MEIPYLSQFWEAITSATEGTIEWFESVGNAVAGALGNLLFYPLQAIFDILLAVAYLFTLLWNFLIFLFKPILFLSVFLVNAFLGIFQPVEPEDIFDGVDFSAAIAFFEALPFWSLFVFTITGALWVLLFMKTMKLLK